MSTGMQIQRSPCVGSTTGASRIFLPASSAIADPSATRSRPLNGLKLTNTGPLTTANRQAIRAVLDRGAQVLEEVTR